MMSNRKFMKISDAQATAAYVLAYQEMLDFERLYGSAEISNLLLRDAVLHNTKVELIFGNLIPAISILTAPETILNMKGPNKEYGIKPNVYLISVCSPGGGKSQSFTRYLKDPLARIISEKNLQQLTYPEFTFAGLLRAVQSNDGVFLWASDEFGHSLINKITSSSFEWQGFRSALNNFYSGEGISKAFSTRQVAEVSNVFFSIAGSVQPHLFCDLIDKLSSTSDGLVDCFLEISAPPYLKNIDRDSFSDTVKNCPKDWPYIALKYVADQHPKKYELSPEAYEELCPLNEVERERQEMVYRSIEEGLKPTASAQVDVPQDSGSSKDTDNSLRLAVLIHISKYAILNAMRLEVCDIPLVIEKSTFLRASEVVATFKKQYSAYKSIVHGNLDKPSVMDAARLSATTYENMEPDVRELIAGLPGPFVTSRMLLRKSQKLKSNSCTAVLSRLGEIKLGEKDFLGTLKTLKLGAGPTYCFVKAKPNEVCPILLREVNLTLEMYSHLYDKDINHESPLSGIHEKWAEYYESLKQSLNDLEEEPEL